MLLRTHLAVGLAVALYFLPHINNKLLFVPTVLISTVLPEIGNLFLRRNRRTGMRIRETNPLGGLTRTYTFCIIVSVFLTFIYPVLAFPFFLGYSFNLILNSFTPDGITPFWPLKKKSTGNISPGGTIDYTIFTVLLIVDIALLAKFAL